MDRLTRVPLVLALPAILSVHPLSADTTDPVIIPEPTLTVDINEGTGEVVLSWTGTASPYGVVRATGPDFVATPPSILAARIGSTTHSDPVLFDGMNYFYSIEDANIPPKIYGISVSAGSRGDSVELTGLGFASGISSNEVFIGGKQAGVSVLSACDDICQSETFKAAFLDGQGVIEDYFHVSPKLVALGDPIVPCLRKIAQKGEGTFDIECQLREVDGACRTWALHALRAIGTPKARRTLAEFVSTSTDVTLLVVAIREMGGLKDPKARPTLLKLLKHSDADVKGAAITAVAYLLNPSDVDALLAATVSLPDNHLYPAILALFPFRDARFVEPLLQRAHTINDPLFQPGVDKAIAQLQNAIEAE